MKIITSKGQKFDIRDKTDDEIYRMNKKDAISYKWKYLLLKSSILILFLCFCFGISECTKSNSTYGTKECTDFPWNRMLCHYKHTCRTKPDLR